MAVLTNNTPPSAYSTPAGYLQHISVSWHTVFENVVFHTVVKNSWLILYKRFSALTRHVNTVFLASLSVPNPLLAK